MVTAGSLRAGGLFIFVKEMINIAIKLATSITYTADGSQTNFSIPFDYLRPSFVHVAVNDAEVSEGFTVSNRGIMFDTAPAKDALVKIYRKTPTSRLVSWADASILKAIDMTIAEVQQLHILEETSDWTKTNSMALNDEGTAWQGWKHRIENVADPTEAQDVVTKHYLDNEEGSFTATMNALKTKTEEAASTAETNAKQARFNAEKADSAAVGANRDAATALKSANNAKTSETNAKTSETNAATSKEAAQSAATSASSSASEAKSYRDAASTYATNAKNYSENVNVFVPSVSADGVLSWSNKAGLTNPPSVNIKGKDGADGGVTVDENLSATSTNPLQNKAVYDLSQAIFSKIKGVSDDIPTKVSALENDAGYIKTVNNVAPDTNGNVNITVSGGGSNITVDDTLSSTSTNAIQNKAVYAALDKKLDKNGTAAYAYRDSSGYIIYETYAKKTDVATSLNEKLGKSDVAIGAQRALQDGDGNTISLTYVKSVNNTTPDSKGNVNITVSGGGGDSGVSLSAQNTWTAQQTFDIALLEVEKYATAYDSGTSLTPTKSTAVYTATGNFTLDLTTTSYLLSIGQSQIITVYIKSSADYALTLKGAGTVKYIGAASDLAITSAGLLLNILMMLDNSGNLTSIVQASKLS